MSMPRVFRTICTFSLPKSAFYQKIRTFSFSKNRTFPKNQDFHQKSLHMRVLILSKVVYSLHIILYIILNAVCMIISMIITNNQIFISPHAYKFLKTN